MISRRDMLRIGATGAAAIGSVAAGLWLNGREGRAGGAALPKMRDHRVEKVPGEVEMAIARGSDAAANVRRAIDALGGMGRFVKKGERVVVKPNVGWNRLPMHAANTNPAVVAEVVRHVIAAGAGKIWVTDVPVNTAEECFARSGVQKAAQEAGATVILPQSSSFREVDVAGKILRTADVLSPFVDADRVINLPIVKQHGLCSATLAMKNWYGVLGGQRRRLHQRIHESLVDLAAFMRPALTVMDAYRILARNGPTGGSARDVEEKRTVVASLDPVAIDAYTARAWWNLDTRRLRYLALAEERGLGRARFEELRMKTVDMAEHQQPAT